MRQGHTEKTAVKAAKSTLCTQKCMLNHQMATKWPFLPYLSCPAKGSPRNSWKPWKPHIQAWSYCKMLKNFIFWQGLYIHSWQYILHHHIDPKQVPHLFSPSIHTQMCITSPLMDIRILGPQPPHCYERTFTLSFSILSYLCLVMWTLLLSYLGHMAAAW